MMAYLDDTPILGVPACGMFFQDDCRRSSPSESLRRRKDYKARHYQLRRYGLCMQCDVCVWPKCTFGK